MNIAVASNGLEVSPYFECCTNYNYFTIDQGMVKDYRNFPILAQQSLSPINILRELGIDVVIVGCVKNTNRALIEELGIEVVCRKKGEAKEAVEDYLSEEDIFDDSLCDNYKAAYGEEGNCRRSFAGA
ncbi:MAG: NifB/NifX family molybdenum-iron cluster-binding protein [Raoultibacter sp.]|jgi:predicted Fe-Mo cluster-binding NifX family protein